MDDFEARFRAHLEEAKTKKGLRAKQAFFNFRTFYLLPVALSAALAKPIADVFFSAHAEQGKWLLLAYGAAMALTPLIGKRLWKDKAFDSERVYLLEALKETLKTEQGDKTTKS